MSSQPGAMLYTQGFASRPENVEVPHLDVRNPTISDAGFPIGKRWINRTANTEFSLTGLATVANITTATWTLLGAGAGDLNTLTADDATIATPSSATITVSGGSTGLTTTASGATLDLTGTLNAAHGGTGAATLTGLLTGNGTSAVTANAITQHGLVVGGASNAAASLAVAATGTLLAGSTGANPAFTASPSVTGSITAGTTLTATLGAITATNGNLVLGTTGNKLVIHASTAASDSIGTATLGSGGTVVVSTSAVTASSIIFLSYKNLTSALACNLDYGTIMAGVSFTVTSQDTTDSTSTFNYWIVN